MIIEKVYYYIRRWLWMARLDLLYLRDLDVNIDKPIFFVGHQGNGSTLISRVFRRIEGVVTVSGNHNYFTGADEMQSVMGPILPSEFTGILHKVPKLKDYSKRRGWMYACDDLLPYYKFSEYDYNKNDAEKFKKAIKVVLKMYGNSFDNKRFLDKSQSYALKIPLLNKVFEGTEPKFIAIFRNPYAVCWRSAYLKTGLSKEKFNIEAKLKVACEHWNNSFRVVKEELDLPNVMIVSIENILSNFEQEMFKIANFIDVELEENHFPNSDDKIPFGSKRRERWHPVKKDINSKYFNDIPDWAVKMISKICSDGINYFGYTID